MDDFRSSGGTIRFDPQADGDESFVKDREARTLFGSVFVAFVVVAVAVLALRLFF